MRVICAGDVKEVYPLATQLSILIVVVIFYSTINWLVTECLNAFVGLI